MRVFQESLYEFISTDW